MDEKTTKSNKTINAILVLIVFLLAIMIIFTGNNQVHKNVLLADNQTTSIQKEMKEKNLDLNKKTLVMVYLVGCKKCNNARHVLKDINAKKEYQVLQVNQASKLGKKLMKLTKTKHYPLMIRIDSPSQRTTTVNWVISDSASALKDFLNIS